MSTYDEKLISAVQMYPIIYIKSMPGHRDRTQIENAWRGVADIIKCGVPPEDLKSRWKVLRERYSREKRASTPASGSAAVKCSTWQYFTALHFLSPHVNARRSYGNYTPTETETSIEASADYNQVDDNCTYPVEYLDEEDYVMSLNNFTPSSQTDVRISATVSNARSTAPSTSDSGTTVTTPTLTKRTHLQAPTPDSFYRNKKQKYDDIDMEFIATLKSMQNSQTNKTDEENELFGRSMACVLSKLPKSVSRDARLTIFTMLTNLDKEHNS